MTFKVTLNFMKNLLLHNVIIRKKFCLDFKQKRYEIKRKFLIFHQYINSNYRENFEEMKV